MRYGSASITGIVDLKLKNGKFLRVDQHQLTAIFTVKGWVGRLRERFKTS